jgi:predicted metal-dependent peptidase
MSVDTSTQKKKGSSLNMSSLLDFGDKFPADQAEEALCRDRVGRVVSRRLPATSSSITSLFASVCHKVYVGGDAPLGGTWATAVDAAGDAVIFITVPWTNSIDTDDGVLILPGHEVYHWIFRHHRNPLEFAGMDEQQKTILRQVEDAMINYLLIRQGFQLPTINGQPVGIDPVNFHKWGREQAQKNNISWPDHHRDTFKTEKIAYDLFSSLPRPKNTDGGKGGNWCKHGDIFVPGNGDGDGHGSCGDLGDQLPLDRDAIDKILTQVIEVTAKQAAKNQSARDELEQLIGATEGNEAAEHFWGSTGALGAVGRVPKKRMSSDWQKDVISFIGTRISDEQSRLRYNKKVPFSPRISPKGRSKKKFGVVGVDVSGSVSQEWRTHFIEKMGAAFPELEIEWCLWDAQCHPVALGEEGTGGGGTVWECFDDYVWEKHRRNPPDFILTVTDGYFAKPKPKFNPGLYGWVIIAGGDPFMGTPGGYVAADGSPVPRMRVIKVLDEDSKS